MSPTNLSSVPRWAKHHFDHAREILVELRDQRFGIAPLGDRGEAAHVREQHAHRPPLPAQLGELGVLEHLIEHVLWHVAREQPLDLSLFATLDEVLPREPAYAGESHGHERCDERQPVTYAKAARPAAPTPAPVNRVPGAPIVSRSGTVRAATASAAARVTATRPAAETRSSVRPVIS